MQPNIAPVILDIDNVMFCPYCGWKTRTDYDREGDTVVLYKKCGGNCSFKIKIGSGEACGCGKVVLEG